jgi:hypothetical protein
LLIVQERRRPIGSTDDEDERSSKKIDSALMPGRRLALVASRSLHRSAGTADDHHGTPPSRIDSALIV